VAFLRAGRMKIPPSRSSTRTFDFAFSPRTRRMGAGRTIWPLLERVVCTSYFFLPRKDVKRLVVDVFAVSDGDDQDEEHLVLDLAEDAKIAHPIAP